MKALYTQGASVPWQRVMREHRAALLPLVVVLGINIIALVAVVLPLSQRAASIDERAATAERTRAAAEGDFKRTDAARMSSSRATEDLATFYRDVLPSNVAAARRIFQLRLRQLADAHGVQYQGSGTTEEQIKDSNLLRLMMSMQLAGSYGDIRGFIHDLETSSDFVVIEQIRLSEGTRGEAALELNLDVSTYYRNAQAAVRTGNDGR